MSLVVNNQLNKYTHMYMKLEFHLDEHTEQNYIYTIKVNKIDKE